MKKFLIASAVPLLAVVLCQARLSCALPVNDPLIFTNESGQAVSEIYFTPCGRDRISNNLLGDKPLGDGEVRALDIGRSDIFCRCDMKLVLADGEEVSWHRLQLSEIFAITLDKEGRAVYQTISLRS